MSYTRFIAMCKSGHYEPDSAAIKYLHFLYTLLLFLKLLLIGVNTIICGKKCDHSSLNPFMTLAGFLFSCKRYHDLEYLLLFQNWWNQQIYVGLKTVIFSCECEQQGSSHSASWFPKKSLLVRIFLSLLALHCSGTCGNFCRWNGTWGKWCSSLYGLSTVAFYQY